MNSEKVARWTERLQTRQTSGLTVEEWCMQNQVTKHTYYYWKRRIKRLQETNEDIESNLVFAEIHRAVPSASGLQVAWRDLNLSISNQTDAALAAEFISQLQKRC